MGVGGQINVLKMKWNCELVTLNRLFNSICNHNLILQHNIAGFYV